MRILLLEDDKLLGEGICTGLRHFSHTVDWLERGRDAISALQNNEFSLLILDLGLPDMDGVDVLKTIRKNKNTIPILILTARDHIDDKLSGLDCGADDYMVKPFDIRELEARIRTLVRRQHNITTETIVRGRAILNCANRIMRLDGNDVSFSRREYALVKIFFEEPDKVLSREKLESMCYGWQDEVESNALEVHIHNLRKKLGSKSIKTIRGVGYMLVSDELL